MRGSTALWVFAACRATTAALLVAVVALVGFGCDQTDQPPTSSKVTASAPSGQAVGDAVPGSDAPTSEVAVARDDRPRIVAFGDSLTAGLGVPSEDSYPARLQRRLDDAGYRYQVVNAGVSGDTTAGGVRRVDWVLRSRPSIVIVEFGGNDGLRGLDLDQTRANFERIVTRLQAGGAQIILAGMQLPPNYGREYTIRFAKLYPELARKYDVTLMPFFLEGVAAQVSLNQADGIHPTGAGYEVIVNNLMKTLAPLLNQPRSRRVEPSG